MFVLSRAFPDSVVYDDPLPAIIAAVFLFLCYLNILVAHYDEIKKLAPSSIRFIIAILITLSAVSIVSLPTSISVLGIVISLGFTLSLFSPVCAVNVFMTLLIIRPWELSRPHPVLLLIPKSSAGIALLSWLLYMFIKGRITIYWCLPFTLLSAWIGWIALNTLLLGGDIGKVAEDLIPATVVTLLLYNTPQRLTDIALIRSILLTSISAVITNAYYLTLTYSSLLNGGRLETIGFWSNSNDLGSLTAISIPIVATTFLIAKPTRLEGSRFSALIVLLLLLMTTWHTQSRATLLAAALSLTIAASFSISKRYQVAKIVLGMVIVIGGIFSTFMLERNESDLEGSSESRKGFIIAGLKMAADSPLLGMGYRKFPVYYDQYATTFIETGPRDAHNSWILPLAETGLPGFIVFTTFMFLIAKSAWQLRHSFPLFFVTFLSYVITMSFLSHTYLFLPYLICGWILGATRVINDDPKNL
jgi:O-antigen ligase